MSIELIPGGTIPLMTKRFRPTGGFQFSNWSMTLHLMYNVLLLIVVQSYSVPKT